MPDAWPSITDEPVRGGFAYLEHPWLLSLPGVDQLRAFVDDRLPAPPIHHLSGLRLSEAGLGTATSTMPASPWWRSGVGIFLGGTLAFAADMALGGAIYSTLPSATALLTSELTLSFLRPASVESENINARGRLIQAGRSQGLSEAVVEDSHGRLLAFATSRCIISPLPFEPMPVPEPLPVPEPVASDTPDPYLRPPEGSVRGTNQWEGADGIDLMRRWLADDPPVPPVGRLTGWHPTEIEEGAVTWVMPASRWFCGAHGGVYGGAIAMLADVAANGALTTTLPAGTAYGTLDLKVHFLRSPQADESPLVARAHVARRGRTVAVVTVDIEDGAGRPVAMATSSSMILAERPWEAGKPVAPIDEAPPREP